VVVCISRRLLVKQYFKLGIASGNPLLWERLFAAGNFAGGIVWGMAAIFLFPENLVPHQYMLALFISGIGCGAAAFYWPSPSASIPIPGSAFAAICDQLDFWKRP
jgi:hypothetical protein